MHFSLTYSRYFYQGAVDVYMSRVVYIGNSTFEHNGPVSVLKSQQWRGHSAGLSIGTRESTNNSGIHFMVTDCTFRNNTSNAPPGDVGATTTVLATSIFPGRGGGFSILVNIGFPANATIENCVIKENSATYFGGGFYLGFSGYSSHNVVINKTKFVRNRCDSAGGLQYGVLQGIGRGANIVFLLTNAEFVENSGRLGGGMHIYATGKWRSKYLLPIWINYYYNSCTYTCSFSVCMYCPRGS